MWAVVDGLNHIVVKFKSYKAAKNWIMKRVDDYRIVQLPKEGAC